MDNTIRIEIEQLEADLKKAGHDISDPVAGLIVTALLHQAQKIRDEIENMPQKVADRLCTYFIPRNKTGAVPSICLVRPELKSRKGLEPHVLTSGTVFSYKLDAKQTLSYSPLFANLIIPFSRLHLLTPHVLKCGESVRKVTTGRKGQVWLGMEVDAEIETFNGLSFLIKGTGGLLPERISVGNGSVGLAYSPVSRTEDIPMLEPFDSQQSMDVFLEVLSCWKSVLSNMEDARLFYITDSLDDRDAFKCRAYPKAFQQMLESSELDLFENNTLWVLFDFGDDYEVPDEIEIIPNAVPVANVSQYSVTLTQTSPMARLTKNDGSFFLKVVETSSSSHKQGFSMVDDEVVIRDFGASCYDSNALYRDVRNLYNHFVDDYHAFMEYHGLKDGELIKSLRETVNRIGKSVMSGQEGRAMFDEGVYAMRNVNLAGQTSSIRVSYLTTHGALGNTPKAGEMMENRKDAALEKDVAVIMSGTGGEDKADADRKYELLRYYTLTSDRLYTKMDIDAFLRMQLLKEFGKDEVRRIGYNITVQGAGCGPKLGRGLYVDIFFKDSKNYQKARAMSLDRKLRQLMTEKSCISMPIMVNLSCMENY